MKCEDIRKELVAFLCKETEDQTKKGVQNHLAECTDCARELQQQKRLSAILQTWKGIDPPLQLFEKLESQIEDNPSFWGWIFTRAFLKKAALRFVEVAVIVAATLIIGHQLWKQDTAVPTSYVYPDIISLYLNEHRGAALQTVSQDVFAQTETRISLRREDILYYEHIDSFSRTRRPGIILRRPKKSQREFGQPEKPSISKGKILTSAQARKAVDFAWVAPSRLHPGYILDSIRKIDNFNCLHLVFTNGIDTISLFEQPLNVERRLAARDFREFAVYRSTERAMEKGRSQEEATILAWKDRAISFVLIAKLDMSRLMDMTQFISAAFEGAHGYRE
jgi:hypothetical protein